MAVAALVTNTRSPEPPNSALLNFMKGLAVQFMSLTAEDVSEQRRGGMAAPLQMRLNRTRKSFTPDSTFFSSCQFIQKKQTRDMTLDGKTNENISFVSPCTFLTEANSATIDFLHVTGNDGGLSSFGKIKIDMNLNRRWDEYKTLGSP